MIGLNNLKEEVLNLSAVENNIDNKY